MTDNPDARAPYADQRKNHIIDRLRSSGRIDAVEIAEALGVTGETIRKDLISLERQGLLRRVHGGAVPVQSLAFEPSVETRTQLASEKIRIAEAALNHLPAQGSVLIDAGSTTAKLVELQWALFKADGREIVKKVGGVERIAAKEFESGTVKLVRSGFGNHADLATGSRTELGRKVA